jgi:RNA polymerase sigma-70 factor (ECF subfamily)
MTDVAADPSELESRLEQHRAELTAYCYRMLGSAFEAEDAVQETLLRAWRAFDRFEGRSSLRSWLYRIATNVCLDALNGRQRRALPMDLGPAKSADAVLAAPLPDAAWIEPIPDSRAIPRSSDPAELAVTRESIRLAFVAALQYLPARQRAVLILRDVLRLKATEVAELLDTSVASVNSALQRARATLAANDVESSQSDATGNGEAPDELLARYVDAFERYDIDSFVSLLHEDATQTMPPYELWLCSRDEMGRWMSGQGIDCKGSRLIPARANGRSAFGQYRPSGPSGRHEPWSIHVIEMDGDRISSITYFLDTNLFPLFGLPAHPDD